VLSGEKSLIESGVGEWVWVLKVGNNRAKSREKEAGKRPDFRDSGGAR